jgi:sugar lactone lactonase YvrE
MRTFSRGLLPVLAWVACAIQSPAQSFSFSTPVGLAGQPGTADGTNANARFREPSGIAVDASGTVYVADTANHVIRRVVRSGNGWVVKTLAGSPGSSGSSDGTNSSARFFYPYGVTVNGAGTLYVSDTYNHTIRKIVPVGTNWVVTTLAGNAGASGSADGTGPSANFYYPYGLAIGQGGNIFVADAYNHIVRQLTPSGQVTTIAGSAGFSGIVNGTNDTARFYYPSGLAADSAGNLFLADTYNCLVRQVTHSGTDWIVTTLAGLPRYAGSADGTNRFAQFNYPFGIAVSGSGALYVADTVNDAVRVLTASDTNWIVSTVGGLAGFPGNTDGPGSSARFDYPYGVAIDSGGNLLVADTHNHTLRYGRPGFYLQAVGSSGQVIVSWPLAASNYLLETSSSLAPGALWSTQGGITVSGNSFVKTNPIGSGPAFFRLHAP